MPVAYVHPPFSGGGSASGDPSVQHYQTMSLMYLITRGAPLVIRYIIRLIVRR